MKSFNAVSRCCLGMLLVVAAACAKKNAGPQMAPPEVAVLMIAPQPVAETFEFPGVVQAYRSVQVRSRVDGIILARPFTEGMMVRPGQVLYRLDKVRYQSVYDADLARYRNAKAMYERLQPLLAQHAVAPQDVDNAQAALTAAQAALESARKDLADTDVKAEAAGRIGRTLLDVGARVTGSSDVLTTIDQLDPIYVSFQPSSQQLSSWEANPKWASLVQPGSRLQVRVVAADSTVLPITGRIDYVAPALNAATGTQEFRAIFSNPQHLLTPGQFVRVRLVGFQRDSAFTVPERAVQAGLGRQYVYVLAAGDTVRARDVETGPWSNGNWIITRGLTAGDRVIVDGIQKVAPGAVAKAVPYVETTTSADSAAAPANPQ